MSDLTEELRIKASVMESGERIKWGSDTELMYKAADEIDAKEKRIEELEQRIQDLKKELNHRKQRELQQKRLLFIARQG